MSGHNKWSKVKHQKAVTDARKSKVFGQMSKLIASESKHSSGNRESPGLKAAIERAKRENMPKDNIERAIAKGVSGDATDMESVRFETYGPGGTAILIEGVTDNNNRTSGEIKSILSKHGCQLAEMGAAAWAFQKDENGWQPVTMIPVSDDDKQKLQGIIEAVQEHDDVEEVYTNAA